jgi:4-amino-4-deoxy-L-arabinose transferase-like glycosyltransferase
MFTRTLRFNSALIHTVILFAISLPYCINLGKSSIWDANEAFYAETPREMLVTGDYLAPQFNFQPRAQKPPLTYWIILISYKLFGVSEFGVRLPSALAAIGTLLFSYGIARLLFGPRAALISAVITGTTARVFILARRLPIDILLLFFLTATFFFLVRAIQKTDRRSWVFFYICASLGFLTKGPIAVSIPVGSFILWALLGTKSNGTSGRFSTALQRLRDARPAIGIAIFSCIVLPWYVLVFSLHGWTYISPFFLRDNLGRFAAESLGPSRGLFYYVSVFASDFFPWSLLLLPAIHLLWKYRQGESFLGRFSFQLPLIWCALIFVFFSLSKNKQEYYIAPLYPVAAALLAGIIDRSAAKKEKEQESSGHVSWLWAYGFLVVMLLFLSSVIPFALSSFMPGISPVLHYSPSIILLGGIVLIAWGMIRRGQIHCFSALAASLWAIYVVCALLYLPALEAFRPVKSFCQLLDTQLSEGDEAGFYGTALPSMAYYLRRPIFEESNPEEMVRRFQSGKRVFCILSRRDLRDFDSQKDLKLYILDRHSRFAVRLNTLLNAGYFPGEELLLVSNRPQSKTVSGRSSPKS